MKSAYFNVYLITVQIISGLESQSKFQIFTLFFCCQVQKLASLGSTHGGSILGSVNLCKTFRQIF